MSYIEAKSGHWIGYYMQYRDRHVFSINLHFEADSVEGSGDDEIGTFSIKGTFDPITEEINFVKRYHGAHSVNYSGLVSKDGFSMEGKYDVSGFGDNDFHMSVNTWW